MKIDFNSMTAEPLMNFKGGKKSFDAKISFDGTNKILHGTLRTGASIGIHTHDTSSEIIYVLSGKGVATFDGVEETLLPGECHYCPKGHSHGLENKEAEDLVFFAVIPEQ